MKKNKVITLEKAFELMLNKTLVEVEDDRCILLCTIIGVNLDKTIRILHQASPHCRSIFTVDIDKIKELK